jgi:hypothetical protein
MNSAIPFFELEPALRAEVEASLVEGETLSEFVESSVRQAVAQRRSQAEFIARGMRSLANAKRTGLYVDADAVVRKLEQRLAAAVRHQREDDCN